MKVALYARYSSDNQRDASITDQFRVCRAYAEKQGWQIVEEYSDHAISGASLLRAGVQALITDALRGRFQVVLAEAMDRLSRDQEDIAGVFKRMAYANVKIITLSEGEVTHLHVGLKGTMNALFLKDLADKTRRGLRGRVELGKSGGGNSYGYDVVKQFQTNGEPIRGDRVINTAEADVVRRIFRDYVVGKSAKRIAVELNKAGIAAPGRSDWGFSTINGNVKRGNGILNNEMYIGRIVWNRQRFIKDPETGKRQARPNPAAEWIIQEVPELRIVDDGLWNAAKARQAAVKTKREDNGSEVQNSFRDRRRPKYIFSGLIKCACCGGGYAMISADLIGCSTARNKGTCDNRRSIQREQLEARVLNALRYHLMDPALFNAKMVQLRSRKAELERLLVDAEEPPPLLHPEMATFYRAQVSALHEALQADTEATRLKAGEVLRSLVKEIVLTPEAGELKIDVRGDLAGILAVSLKTKTPATGAEVSQFEMVAGIGFEPMTFRL
ncbi:recombinase family protein [Bradyrhizobium sp. Ash2021]|uniref:recombinase family protein n=1 Tax=Bradyrhizobium sp. Ash2021 TaxID=2954771 RepID=UPI002815B5FC|nr:recombinase family protein [Bradyrhizobium sp. Ash2021]WMT76430.1 recombinase family protein [Bradyrhizobium sp. Ash2021]